MNKTALAIPGGSGVARALEGLGEGKFEVEGWRVRKDGTPLWPYVVIDPIRAPDGRPLRQSQEQFRLLVQGVSDYAIFLLDPDGVVQRNLAALASANVSGMA